jgi:hypothetical protein
MYLYIYMGAYRLLDCRAVLPFVDAPPSPAAAITSIDKNATTISVLSPRIAPSSSTVPCDTAVMNSIITRCGSDVEVRDDSYFIS